MNPKSHLKLADDVTFQSLGPKEQTVVLSLSSGHLYTCNDTTASFLRALDGRRSLSELVNELAKEYDVPAQRLQSDMEQLASKMLQEKLIVEAD
jgi:hypothetical protein